MLTGPLKYLDISTVLSATIKNFGKYMDTIRETRIVAGVETIVYTKGSVLKKSHTLPLYLS
jgi:hypothetical protein